VSVDRFFGADRYATARAANAALCGYYGFTPSMVGVASGAAFADALSGGALLGANGGILVLSPGDRLGDEAEALLLGYTASWPQPQVRLFGGVAVLAPQVAQDVAALFGWSVG